MKKITLLLALAFLLPVRGDDSPPPPQLVATNSGKAVTFPETVSPDGQYVVGWTIRLHKKNAKPIDWSLWDPSDHSKFMDAYAGYLPNLISDKDDYEFINCLIDLKGKQVLPLPTEDPVFPGADHGDINAVWSPTGQGKRYVLVGNDFRASTENLWIITIDSSGMHQVDVTKSTTNAVYAIIADKRPLVHHGYEVRFDLDSNDAAKDTPKVAFHDQQVTVPFYSDAYKNETDNSEIKGTVILNLATGTLVKTVSLDARDDPFKDMPELAKADHELNQIYGQLSKKLSAEDRAALKSEQLDWINQRDGADEEQTPDARNKLLLESTQKRVKELQDRLNALH